MWGRNRYANGMYPSAVEAALSKTKALEQYDVTEADIATLAPIAIRNGRYCVYNTYSRSSLRRLQTEVANRAKNAAKWELAEAKRAAKWELAEAKRLAKAAATAVKEAALAEKKRKTLKAQQDKEMDASIRNFGGQDGWEADCMHEAALVEMQRARHTLERVQALPHVARRAPHIVVAAVELVIKAKAEVDLTASALTAYPKAAAAGEQARASSSSSSTIGYSSEVKLPPSQTGDQISPDSVVAMSISPAILPLPTSASVTPNSGGDKKRKRVEVGIAPVSADGSKILEEDANTDFIDLVAASCSFDHAQTVIVVSKSFCLIFYRVTLYINTSVSMIIDKHMMGFYMVLVALVIAVGSYYIFGRKKKSYPMTRGFLSTLDAINTATVEGTLPQLFNKWTDQFGPVYGFQMFTTPVCVISDPDLATKVFTQTALFPSRGQTGMTYFIPQSLLGYRDNDAQWKMHRKILSGAFTDNCLKKYADAIVMVGESLVDKLKATPVAPSVNALMAETAYLVLAHTVLGGDAWLKHFSDVGTREEMEAVLKMVGVFTFSPTVLWNILVVPGRALGDAYFRRQAAGAADVIADIRRNNRQGSSIMHFLIQHESKLSDQEVMEELMSFVMAGHETTANTLAFSLIALAIHPEHQITAREELARVLQGKPFTYDCIAQLPFIWSIIRETLRIFPTVPFTFRDSVTDTRLGSHDIARGTRVCVNMMHICHNPAYFADPETFNPGRWMTPETTMDTLKNHDITRNFGGGLRMCIGKRFSEEEQVILLSMMLSEFGVSLVSVGGRQACSSDTMCEVSPSPSPSPSADEGSAGITFKLADITTKTNITMTSAEEVSLKFTVLK